MKGRSCQNSSHDTRRGSDLLYHSPTIPPPIASLCFLVTVQFDRFNQDSSAPGGLHHLLQMALLSPVASRPCIALGAASPAPLSLSRLHSSLSASVSPSCSSASLRSVFYGRCLLLHFASSPFVRQPSKRAGCASASTVTQKSIHDFTVKDIDGKNVSLSNYKGKVLLIVNVASRCGLTTSNYTQLAQLYSKLKGQDFEILAFPCNQFAGQEPGSNREIKQFACSRFKAEYPIFDKVDVNGFNTAPVYKFLKTSKSSGLLGGLLGDNIKWNFEKFLVDKNGQVVQRFDPTTSPLQIEKDIRKLLSA